MKPGTSGFRPEMTAEFFNGRGAGHLPGLVGVQILSVTPEALESRLEVRRELLAPNGFLHAASVIALADTAAGYATIAHLPEGATNFTTVELKSNFIGTATEGSLRAEARAVHQGRTTQVWDSIVTHVESGRTIALFRCTQMIIWPKHT